MAKTRKDIYEDKCAAIVIDETMPMIVRREYLTKYEVSVVGSEVEPVDEQDVAVFTHQYKIDNDLK